MAEEYNHRHLREIDCSSAVVGRLAEGAESGGKSIHWTRTWLQKVLHSRCCGWRHNYYSQQRHAGRSNEQSTSLRCLWVQLTNSLTHTRTPLRCTKWKYKQRNISSFNKKNLLQKFYIERRYCALCTFLATSSRWKQLLSAAPMFDFIADVTAAFYLTFKLFEANIKDRKRKDYVEIKRAKE